MKVNNTAVGENLHDQPLNIITFQGTNQTNITGTTPYATFATASDLFGSSTSEVAESSLNGLRSWAEAVMNASSGALNATALEYLFHVQHDLIFKQDVPCAEFLLAFQSGTFIGPFWNLLPFSRGSVHIGSADPVAYPVIDPDFFLLDWELAVQAAISRLARRFWSTNPISEYIVAESQPGLSTVPANATDAEWEPFITSSCKNPLFHYRCR